MPSKLDITMTLPGDLNTVEEAPTGIIQKFNTPNASPQMVSRRHHAQVSPSTLHVIERFDQEMTSAGNEGVKEMEKKSNERIKKKTPWYSALHPTYKSRSEDFKRIFKDVIPVDERLIVDYSSAIQRDILVHGRLYASQNYLCFYANIFRWETMMSVQWKEVTAITKEKTALVIPNAILIHTNSEKHFLTSFGARDKTYLMLFRIWQNALMDMALPMQEIWQWVHSCYGDELGLTSDDDDYVPPYNDCNVNSDTSSDKFGSEIPLKEFSRDECIVEEKLNGAEGEKIIVSEPSSHNSKVENGKIRMEVKCNRTSESHLLKPLADGNELTTDVSDNTDSDEDQPDVIVNCPSAHDGRLLVQVALPFSVDHIFTLLFTESDFMKNLHESRKNTDVSFSPWEVDSGSNQKVRKGTLVVPITQPVGPKTSNITETQIMQNCSKPGNLYVIDTESNNAGIPYADSFYISSHFCIIRNPKSPKECTLNVYSQIKYRKSVWGLVRSFIEKNCWSGLEEYYNSLSKALEGECEKSRSPDTLELSNKRKVIRKRRQVLKTGIESSQPYDETPSTPLPTTMASVPIEKPSGTSEKLSWAILFTLILLASLNGILYYKLWSLEAANYFDKDIPSLESYLHRHTPRTPEEWLELLYKQERSYHKELTNWNKLIKSTISLLRQAEDSLSKLERNFQQVVSEQVLSTLKNSLDLDNNEINNENSESKLTFSNKI